MNREKKSVHDFWDAAACGEALYLDGPAAEKYSRQAATRYRLEPYILSFADFAQWRGRAVLEIGVGLGADHQKFAEAGAILTGLDLTRRAVIHTASRFRELGLETALHVGDAENLPFRDATYDLVYSWGVLHHSPDTAKAIDEVYRVLRPGGTAKIMIYHKQSLVGYMLWIRYALMRMQPWLGLSEIYRRYLESPGTKAYTVAEAKRMFHAFRKVQVEIVLTHGDLLESAAGARHHGLLLSLARRLWPRNALKRLARGHGLFMLVSAVR